MPAKEIISILNNNQQEFHPVVPFEQSRDKLLSLDFTANNHELAHDILTDTKKFISYINDKLARAHARYGIGGYAEHRTIYSMSKVFDADKPGIASGKPMATSVAVGLPEVTKDDEPRRLHLGVDIWGKPHTRVMAPLNGIVHSFAFNNDFGDYGTTIILSHSLGGFIFYTLYGHLSLNSIKNMQEGDTVGRGDVFGEFGIPAENGHWPPHLHFQVIIDMENLKGDYPGVCKYSEKEKYLRNCPDPDLILQLNRYLS